MIPEIFGLGAVSFVISWLLTALMIRFAPRIGLVDKPGHRKIHTNPRPLGGGIAIFWSLAIPLAASLTAFWINRAALDVAVFMGADSHEELWRRMTAYNLQHDLHAGVIQQMPLAMGLLLASLAMHLLGLVDDRRPMGPFAKLIAQLAVATALVGGMEVLARHTPSLRLRALTVLDSALGLGSLPSIILTVLWIVAITNAFNFLDNMDGLSAGVAGVCTWAFLGAALFLQQWFVAATLALLLGAVLGFLWWNFPPAKIFMGDSGSLVIGFLLGVLTVRTTYLLPGQELAGGWYSVLAPLIVLAVPIYDMIVVCIIRISRGKSPFVGDNNHFSHRLVARGMSRRTAVLCIYLVTAATAIAAILLPHVQSTLGAILIFAQTILVLGVVALLEQHPLPTTNDEQT